MICVSGNTPAVKNLLNSPEKISLFPPEAYLGKFRETDYYSQRVFHRIEFVISVHFPEQPGVSPACLRLRGGKVSSISRHLKAQG